MNPSKKSKQTSSNKLEGVLLTNTKINKNLKYILKSNRYYFVCTELGKTFNRKCSTSRSDTKICFLWISQPFSLISDHA